MVDQQEQQPESAARPQMQALSHPVKVKELWQERESYENFPSYQRDKVWTTRYKQALIDTILLGGNVPSLTGYKEMDSDGKTYYWINDGQQRMSAILDFLDGKFKTWTYAQKQGVDPGSIAPVQPGKFFEQLNPWTKNILLSYVLFITVEPKTDINTARANFRHRQNQMSLTRAELIDTYESDAKDLAIRLEKNEFWPDFYIGIDKHRKELRMSCYYLIGLELVKEHVVDLKATNYVTNLAAGKKDEQITQELVDLIEHRIEMMKVLFSGSHFTIRNLVIPMYQAVAILEDAGIRIHPQEDRGKLTPWLQQVVADSRNAVGLVGWERQLPNITAKKKQVEFWARHRRAILSAFGARDAVVQQ